MTGSQWYAGVAYRLFSRHTSKHGTAGSKLESSLKRARMFSPVQIYISKAYLTGCIAGAIGMLLVLLASLLWRQALDGMFSFNGVILFVLLLCVLSFVVFFSLCVAIYYYYPEYRAGRRGKEIDAMLPHAMTFLYSMANGGQNPLEAMRSLSENREVYGEASVEFGSVVKGVELLGYDLISSMKDVSSATPSEHMKNFLESSASLMESGGGFNKFLYSRIEQSREMAAREQKTMLEVLGMMGEVYVTALVAGPLFIIIVMVVIGMIGNTDLLLMQMIVYVLIPLTSVAFIGMLYAIGMAQSSSDRIVTVRKELNSFKDVPVAADGGVTPDYPGWKYRLVKFGKDPLSPLLNRPGLVLYVSVPAAIITLAWLSIGMHIPSINIGFPSVAHLDNYLLIAFMIAILPFTVLWEAGQRRIRKIDAQVPEFLKRLASINESGLTLDKAIKMLLRSNLGVLNTEIKRMSSDLDWGASIKDALVRFEYRVNTFSIRRIVTLIVKASDSTHNIKDILHIAADDAQATNSLREGRVADMLIYMAIVYLSLFVFLYIAYVLIATFLPLIPASTMPGGGMPQSVTGSPSSMTGMLPTGASGNSAMVRLLMYHMVLLQGLFSGIIVGVMGEGKAYAGLKHSIIMMIIAYVAFTVFI